MNVTILDREEMCRLADHKFNPPVIRDQALEQHFQTEIQDVYGLLLICMSAFGKEGDHYGTDDYAIRPDLRNRPTVKAPKAYPAREFLLTILTEEFFRSGYLQKLYQFLSTSAKEYRIVIDQDFNPEWYLTLFLTTDLAHLYCTKESERTNLEKILSNL